MNYLKDSSRLSLLKVRSRPHVKTFSILFFRLNGNSRRSKHNRNARAAVIRGNSINLQMH